MMLNLKSIVWLAASIVLARANDEASFEQFLDDCMNGKLDAVKHTLEVHPDWAAKPSDQGETCLHVAGIHGHTEVTDIVIDAGGDPNIRTTYMGGLRMHPLSWNVYAGNVENVKRLLDRGADINLDVDSMLGEPGEKVTVLDIVDQIIDGEEEHGGEEEEWEAYKALKELLVARGAKRFTGDEL